MNTVCEHRLRNDLAETRRLGAWVEDFAQRLQLSASVRQAFDLALVECVTNIISHSYEDNSEHWVRIRFQSAPGEARVEVEDDGRAFNPLTVPGVDTNAPLESRPIGGLGVYLIRRCMDEVQYRRENERNILTLIKRLA
jgi:anti-sigma regulatory factor (Ser/Thr protein kinase)